MLNKPLLVVDTETNEGAIKGSLTDLWCIGIYNPQTKTKGLRFHGDITEVQRLLDTHTVIFHHAAFDIWVLESLGYTVTDFHDTMMMSYCLFPHNEHGLRALGDTYECEVTKTDFHDFSQYSEEMGEYCMNDCESTYNIFEKMYPLVLADSAVNSIYQTELEFVRVLIELRHNGVMIDTSSWKSIIGEVQNKQDELLAQILKLVPLAPVKRVTTKNPRPADKVCTEDDMELGKFIFNETKEGEKGVEWTYTKVEKFNPGSSDQLAWAFTHLYGWEPKKFSAKTGKPTVNAEVVELLNNDLAKLIESYSEFSKLTSTFGESLLGLISDDGRLRANFNPIRTATGRLSCSQPNLQTIPNKGDYGSKLRDLFVAPEGKLLVGCDVDSFQMRILAWYLHKYCGSMPDAHALWNDFNTNPSPDPHQAKADLVGLTRKEGKTLNFSVLFGAGLMKVSKQLNRSVRETKAILKRDAAKNPSLPKLIKAIQDKCRQRDGYVYSMYGRRGYYPEIHSSDRAKSSHAERQAFNFVIQGTEADIVKKWSIKVRNESNDRWLVAKLVLQIHDELLWEVDEDDADEFMTVVQKCLQESNYLPGLKLTGTPKKGKSWGEVH
jgi:DNA polymerase I-like protein with 3'-5' exonuclease and polymerase domains